MQKKSKQKPIFHLTLCTLAALAMTLVLIKPAIALSSSTYCGKEEHTHSSQCYISQTPLCQKEEQEEVEGHIHSADCYETIQELICTNEDAEHIHEDSCYQESENLICTKIEQEGAEGHRHSQECFLSNEPLCGKEEHTHSLQCSSNPQAIESKEDWQADLPELSGNIAQDLDAIAYSQVGYQESSENFEVQEDESIKGYTRYGDTAGDLYGDWNTYFIGWIFDQASADKQDVFYEDTLSFWLEKAAGILQSADSIAPGDIVFFTYSEELQAGIIHEVQDDQISVIAGDIEDEVKILPLQKDEIYALIRTQSKEESSAELQAKQEENEEVQTEAEETEPASAPKKAAAKISTYKETYSLAQGSTMSITGSEASSYTGHWWGQSEGTGTIYVTGDSKTCTIVAANPGYAILKHSYEYADSGKQVLEEEYFYITITPDSNDQTYQLVYNLNGVNGTTPNSVSLSFGQSTTLASLNETTLNNAARRNKTFAGWSTAKDHNSTTGKYTSPLYQPGYTYEMGYNDIDVFASGTTITLYAIWIDESTSYDANFYIQLEGKILTEPQRHSTELYTSAIKLSGALKYNLFYADANFGTITSDTSVEGYRLNSEPTASQIASVVNKKSSQTGTTVKAISANNTTSLILCNTSGKPIDSSGTVITLTGTLSSKLSGSNYGTNTPISLTSAEVEELESLGAVQKKVYWYVIKKEESWQIDGVLLETSKLRLSYDANAIAGTFSNVPDGSALAKGETVYVGSAANTGSDYMIPTRTGYVFAGWSLYASGKDENGITQIYQNGDTFQIQENTVLYAQWAKGTNALTVTKTNTDGSVLQGATFSLEAKSNAQSCFEAVGNNQTSNTNGTFTFSNLENYTIYRLTEIYAPNGYETRHAFCFKVDIDEDNANIMQIYLCDEDGNILSDIPDWLEMSYSMKDSKVTLSIHIQDEKISRAVHIYQLDEKQNPISNANYLLTNTETNTTYTLTSDENGELLQNQNSLDLTYGTYKLEQSEAVEGYNLQEAITFTIQNPANETTGEGGLVLSAGSASISSNVQEEMIDNQYTTTYTYTLTLQAIPLTNLEIFKVAKDAPEKGLEGAVFDLYRLDEKGNASLISESLKTNADGILEIEGLAFGEYEIKESKAPEGYIKLEEAIPLSITKENNGIKVSAVIENKTQQLQESDGSYKLTISNSSGTILPQTGGIGAEKLLISGLGLCALSLMGLTSLEKKRRK
jgi:uncharacterized repeat protein (TIGR02543 family)